MGIATPALVALPTLLPLPPHPPNTPTASTAATVQTIFLGSTCPTLFRFLSEAFGGL